MSQPYTKTEIKKFIKETSEMLRHMESDLREENWHGVYECFVAIPADSFVNQYEDWEEEA